MLGNTYHTIRGRTKLPRTLESNSKDPLSAAKPLALSLSHFSLRSWFLLPVSSRDLGLTFDHKPRRIYLRSAWSKDSNPDLWSGAVWCTINAPLRHRSPLPEILGRCWSVKSTRWPEAVHGHPWSSCHRCFVRRCRVTWKFQEAFLNTLPPRPTLGAPVLYHFPLFAAVNEGHPPFSDTPNYPIIKTKVPWFSMFLETFWGSMPAGSRLKSWDRTWIPTAVHFRSFVLKAATSGPSTSQTVGLGFSSFLPDPTKRSPETNEIPRTAWGHQKKPNLIRFFLMILMWMKKQIRHTSGV